MQLMPEKNISPPEALSASEQNLLSLVDSHEEDLITLLQDLISYDSRTYNAETFSDLHPIVSYCEEFFKKFDVPTQVINCPHRDDPNKTWPNLVAQVGGNSSGPRFGFMGHLDIVPFNPENWMKPLSPLQAKIIEGKMYGRGTADMKSGVAAQMMAVALLKKSNLPFSGELQMIFTPDEEIDGNYGAAFLAKDHHPIAEADVRIISEPTGQPPIKSPAIIIGEKGANWFRLTFHGASGHGSQPKRKSNALNKAARFIHLSHKKLKFKKTTPPMTRWDLVKGLLARYKIKDLLKSTSPSPSQNAVDQSPKSLSKEESYDEDGSSLGSFFKSTISFNQIQAGTKTNVIPDTCTLEADIRTLPGITTQDLVDDLVKYASKLGYRIEFPKKYQNLQKENAKWSKRPVDITAEPISTNKGGQESKESELCQILGTQFEKVYGKRRLYFFSPGMTDATHFRKEGINNIVIFGPSGEHAHDANEYVYLEDLILCTKVYLLTAYKYLTKGK